MKLQINPARNYTALVFVCVSRHFEKHNAVITVVTPCKYVSPQIWSAAAGEHIDMRERERRGVGSIMFFFSNLSAVKSARAAEKKGDCRFSDYRVGGMQQTLCGVTAALCAGVEPPVSSNVFV